MRVECDAGTRKIGERHVLRALRNPIRSMMTDLEAAIDAAPFEPCGWTGDVEDPAAWTCPACLAEHMVKEEQ